MRRATAAAFVAVALILWPSVPASAGDPVKDRRAAQARANAAAAKFASATTSLARIERELKELETKTAATRDRMSDLEGEVRQVAVNSYIRSNVGEAFVFDPDLSKQARRNAMARFVTVGDRAAVDDYRAARDDLEVGSASVRRQVIERKSAAALLRKQKAAAYTELARLAAVEKAYLAKIAAEKAAAEKRAAAAKAARSRSNLAAVATVGSESKVGRVSGVIASGDWICPVQGPHSFSNDYGQPRSGGRLHEGNDILNPRGTPIVAPVGGTVKFHDSSLGGLSFYLSGEDGNTYYGTHLGSYAQDGRVTAGTVVGYNGDSGNARGTPHLHFEIHPGGGGPVNPYPTLVKYC
ncbi:MAG TPA: M23 family metallopeptidase [Acidimicrobiales bacterium]|nr:M23 family metallopeptidase [Acidimicrobiales bacterium]